MTKIMYSLFHPGKETSMQLEEDQSIWQDMIRPIKQPDTKAAICQKK